MTRALALAVLLLASRPVLAGESRWALVVGVNRGLGDEEQLRFAEADARRVGAVLSEVGGVARENITTLVDANADAVRLALGRLRSAMGSELHERLFIYISSHAGDGKLHLAGTEMALKELVDFLKESRVRVGVLVVDACQSGRLANMKGLRVSGLAPPRLEASALEGRVLIAASGANEFAQESEALQGSYFTHYFVNGLRGAADTSRDGKVTLDEAYVWAWARTVEATFSSQGGVQRPAYSVDLRGQGQLVMSELSASTARLTLAVEEPGRWLLVAQETGALFADLQKGEGPLSLAVPPGTYRVQRRTTDAVQERTVSVLPNAGVILSADQFETISAVRVVRKGGEESQLTVSAAGGVTSGLVAGLDAEPGLELRLRRDGYLFGLLNQLSATLALRHRAAAFDEFLQSELELRVGAGHRFSAARGSLLVGVDAGPLYVRQTQLPGGTSRNSLALTACAVLEGRLRLVGPLEAVLSAAGGGDLLKKLGGLTVTPRLGASGGLALRF